MNAALYCRYSSSLQSPTSIEDQERVCRNYAGHHGLTVSKVFADREISGAVADRPGYRAMMEAAKRGEFRAILIEHQDRVWRDQEETHSALKRLRHWRVKLFSVATGTIDLTDPRTGFTLATVGGLQSQMYLEDLKEKTRRGMAGQISRGYSAGGAAYGYKSKPEYHPTKKDEYGRPVIVAARKIIEEAEAKVVLRIFEECAAGSSPKTIVHRLNAQCVPPPRPKQGRKAQGWTWTTVRGILRNRLYLGEVYWNRSGKERDPENAGRRVTRKRPRDEWLRGPDRPDLRVIPDELWNRVQVRLAEATKASRGRPGGPRPQYLFSGLLRCGECGAHYIIKDKRGYACSFYLNRGRHVCANSRTAKREVLERILLAEVQDAILSPESLAYLVAQVNRALKRRLSREAPERKALEAELRDAKQQLQNVKDAILEGIRTSTTRSMLEELEERVQRLRAETSGSPKAKASVQAVPGLVEAYAKDLKATLGHDVDRARALLSGLLGEIVLRPEGDGLMYEMRGNFGVLLEGKASAAIGAGRGI